MMFYDIQMISRQLVCYWSKKKCNRSGVFFGWILKSDWCSRKIRLPSHCQWNYEAVFHPLKKLKKSQNNCAINIWNLGLRQGQILLLENWNHCLNTCGICGTDDTLWWTGVKLENPRFMENAIGQITWNKKGSKRESCCLFVF